MPIPIIDAEQRCIWDIFHATTIDDALHNAQRARTRGLKSHSLSQSVSQSLRIRLPDCVSVYVCLHIHADNDPPLAEPPAPARLLRQCLLFAIFYFSEF